MSYRNSIFCLFFCCSVILAAATSPSHSFTEHDASNVKGLLTQAQKADGTFADIKTAHHAVWSLTTLKAEVPKKADVCNQAKKVLADAKATAEDIYHAANVAQTLGCAEKASATVTATLQSALASDTLQDIYYAAAATTVLKQHVTIDKEKLVAAADQVKELMEPDGTVLSRVGDEEGNVYNTGLAFQVLGLLHSSIKLPEDVVEGIGENWVDSVVGLGEDDEESLSFSTNDRLPLEVTSRVLRGLFALSDAGLADLDAEHVAKLAEFFVDNKHPTTVGDAYNLLWGLHLLSNNNHHVPLVVHLLTKSVSSTAKAAEGNIKVRVTNVLGQFATKAKVVLTKANAASDAKLILFTNQELTADTADAQNTVYTINFLAAKPEPGFYTLDFKATPVTTGKSAFSAVDSAVSTIAVTTAAVPTQFEVAVSDTNEEEEVADSEKYKLEHPETLKKKLSAKQDQHIHLSFRVKNSATGRPFTPQQAFVKLTNTKSGTEAILLPKFVNKRYKLHVDIGSVEDFNNVSGDYKIEVIVGDAVLSNPNVWEVGTVHIEFTRPSQPKPVHHAPLPEIHHEFRPDEKRAPKSISSAFTGLVFAPILVLLALLGRVGFNFKNFPSGASSLAGLVFTGCLFAYAGLVALFWLQINLLTTLQLLVVLGLVTILAGNKTLQFIASARTKRQ